MTINFYTIGPREKKCFLLLEISVTEWKFGSFTTPENFLQNLEILKSVKRLGIHVLESGTVDSRGTRISVTCCPPTIFSVRHFFPHTGSNKSVEKSAKISKTLPNHKTKLKKIEIGLIIILNTSTSIQYDQESIILIRVILYCSVF